MGVLADQQWSVLEPLLNAARPWAARPIRQLLQDSPFHGEGYRKLTRCAGFRL